MVILLCTCSLCRSNKQKAHTKEQSPKIQLKSIEYLNTIPPVNAKTKMHKREIEMPAKIKSRKIFTLPMKNKNHITGKQNIPAITSLSYIKELLDIRTSDIF